MTNDAGQLERVFAEIERLRGDLVEAVSGAVRIPSVNPKYPGQVYDEVVGGEGETSKFIARYYEALGCDVDVFAIEPGRENAVGVLRGSGGGRSLIFNGHVDVVPPGDPANWTSGDPFSGRVDDDRIWGRGSTDMKGGILAQAFAAQAIRNAGLRLQGDLILEAVVGEEVMDHLCGTTAVIDRGYRADAAVVSEPSSPPTPLAVVPISPGLWWFSVTVRGKASHASHARPDVPRGRRRRGGRRQRHRQGHPDLPGHPPARGHVGPDQDAPAVRTGALHDPPRRRHRRPERRARAVRHLRVHDLRVLRLVPPGGGPGRRAAPRSRPTSPPRRSSIPGSPSTRPSSSGSSTGRPPSSTPRTPSSARVCQAVERATAGTRLEGPATVQGFAAVEDTSWLNAKGIPAISCGAGDLRVAHADDEYVLIDELLAACRTYAATALDWCGWSE